MTGREYRAFISYSHSDTNWAKWLHRAIEGFPIDKDLVGRKTPTGIIPDTLRPIFRDREEFNAGHALPDQTLAALDASAALIIVCSPASAKSAYVKEEVRLFKSRHPDRPLIPLIVAGKPGHPELECFPDTLKFKLDPEGHTSTELKELLAADVRDEGDGKNLSLAKVIAGLLGLSSDEVFRRAERERRAITRRRRRVHALVGGLAFLLFAAGIGWLNQGYLREQLYWRFAMGPTMLTANKERALQPQSEFMDCSTSCPLMVVLPAGRYMMGSPLELNQDGEAESFAAIDEHPQHEVTIANRFAVGKFEVTFAEWDMCVAAASCPSATDNGLGRGVLPVVNVAWYDAQQYVTWLSRVTGKTYRLLTEAEWEYAARAGTTTRFSFGEDYGTLGEYAWHFYSPSGRTHPVGQKKPNGFGLYDMHGNVAEWVEDRWHSGYHSAPQDGSAWIDGDRRSFRVQRGGSWLDEAEGVRSASRDDIAPNFRSQDRGFRVARTLAP